MKQGRRKMYRIRTIIYKCKCGHISKEVNTDFGGESAIKETICKDCQIKKK